MHLSSGASGGRGSHVLIFFSLSLLLLGLLSLPTSALPRSSPSLVIAAYTVNSTADPGVGTCNATECTLREAIGAATGTDTIAFDIPATDPNYGLNTAGVWTIVLASTLNAPSGDIVDGTTQATNYSSDTNPYGPEIEISGESLGPGTVCWFIGSDNTIRGLVINRCPAYGIFISGGDNNTIIGNYIGTDATGTTDQGVGQDGILLNNGAQNNIIGGSSEAERNIISANVGGIRIADATTTGNVIKGNYIGTDRTGTTSLGNGSYGVEIHADADSNTVGPGNIIAYNGVYGGVWVDGASTLYNRITQNSIHSNVLEGIRLTNGGNGNLMAPTVLAAICTAGSGTSGADLQIEVFSDVDGEGRFFEMTLGSASGSFSFFPAGDIFRHRYVTLTATDASGNTSEFSAPYPNGCSYIYLPLIMKNYAP